MIELDGGFSITLFKDNITPEKLTKLGLNDRQIKAVLFLKENGKIKNSDYQTINDVSRETATRDLKELIEKDLISPSGQKGAGAFYTLK